MNAKTEFSPRGPRRVLSRAVPVVLAWAAPVVLAGLLAASCVPDAFALRLPGRSAAYDALRQVDLAAALAGQAPATWRDAAAKLPGRCREDRALSGTDCNEDAQCAWLAARADVIGAFAGQGNREAAASRLERTASRLASARCPKDDDWNADTRTAAVDAARVAAVLLAAGPAAPLPVDGDAGRRAEVVVATVRRGGPGAIDEATLASTGAALRTARARSAWLASVPALAALRAALPELWSGRVPAGCGDELLRNDLLEDQWRGYLVREVVPRALDCVRTKLLPGTRRPDAAALAAEAARLAESARADRGGRNFAADRAAVQSIEGWRRAFAAPPPALPATAVAGAAGRAGSTPAGRSGADRRATPAPAATATSSRAGALAARGASRDADKPLRAIPEPAVPARADGELVRLADRTIPFAPAAEPTRAAAVRARTPEERAQVERELLIALHRSVCGALREADPVDLDAVRRVLGSRGAPSLDRCQPGEGRTALVALLDAAPGLERITAAVRLRSAARLFALGRIEEGRRQIDLVPARLHGTTWAVIGAWGARLGNDPVSATRIIGTVDPETLERLRSSGSEEVARLATHAAAPALR